MELLRKWDTVQSTLEEFRLPPTVEKAVRWMENHPRAIVGTAAVLLVAVVLAQAPGRPTGEQDAYSDETPLFV
jgi:hypothetical protein